jgi:hypothetical protein
VSLGHQLREAIRSDGRRPGEIASAADVAPSIISRFISGERPDLKLSTADALAGVLGLRLTGSKPRRGPKGPAPDPGNGDSPDGE